MDEQGAPVVDDAAVERFWARARDGARLATLPGYLPAGAIELVVPPVFGYGDDAEGRALLDGVLAGTTTSTTTALAELRDAGAPLPEVGTLGILLDADGAPCALVETTAVQVVARRDNPDQPGDPGDPGDPDEPVVREHFRVAYRA